MEPSAPLPEAYQPAIDAALKHDYKLLSVIGRGGTGVVFRAEHKGATVAVKFAWPWGSDVMTADPERELTDDKRFRAYVRQPRFLDDGRGVLHVPSPDVHLVNRVTHAESGRLTEINDDALVGNVVVLSSPGRTAYAMELLEGPALTLKPGPGLLKLAQAVHRLHERGWPHGDLKPENIREHGDSVRLIDPLPVGSDLMTPEWSHLNFLVATPLVDSADPRDRRMVLRHRDLVALALMFTQAFAAERPWGHAEVSVMLSRTVTMDAKRAELIKAREKLSRILPKMPAPLRPFVSLALEPGLWPEEGPTFAAYLQARPFETRCDALSTMDVGDLVEKALKGDTASPAEPV